MRLVGKSLLRWVSGVMCAVALVGCSEGADDNDPQGGGGLSPTTIRQLGEFKTYLADDKISGFSGVCLNEDGTGLYGVDDSGDLYNISFEGKKLGKISLDEERDFEGVAVDAVNKVVYMCEEREWNIYKLNADRKSASQVAHIDVENGVDNKGLEGITCGNGNLYVANQERPTTIFTYSIAEGKVTNSVTVTFAKFLSDLCYDETNNTLWVVDSKQSRLFNIKLDGTLLATYDVSSVPKAEGVCVDYERGVIWFACDSTGRLYSAEINF